MNTKPYYAVIFTSKKISHDSGYEAMAEHIKAQELGRTKWYDFYKTRICKVEREYSMN